VLILPEGTVRGNPCGGSYDAPRDILSVARKSALDYSDRSVRRLLAHELSHAAVLAYDRVYGGEKALWRNERLVDKVAGAWGFCR
jgi:hypothetical protein